MKSASSSSRRLCKFLAVLLLHGAALPTPAAQPPATESVGLCSGALHPTASLGQWDVDLGPELTGTLSTPLPVDRTVLLEAHEVGVDVDVAVAAPGMATTRAANPVRRRALLRVLVHTGQAALTSISVHADADGGPGRHVKLAAYDVEASQTSSCALALRSLVAGDGDFSQARRVSGGHAAPNAGSAADFYTKAHEEYARAFADLAAQNVALRASVAHTLATLSCRNQEQWQECARWSTAAADLFQRAGDALGRANAQSLQALAWMELAQLPGAATAVDRTHHDSHALTDQAMDQLRRLAVFYVKQGALLDAAEQLNLLGVTLYDTGDYTGALRDYEGAEALYEKLGQQYRLALVRQNIALVEWDLGRASTAQSTFRRALSLVNVTDSPRLYAIILDNYGLANRTTGLLDAALAQHAQALDLATSSQDSGERGRSLFGIGMVYSAAGDRGLATDFLHQALDTFTRGGEGRDSVSVLRALAVLAAQDGRHEEAIRLDREALAHATGPIVRTHLLVQIADSESLLGREQAAADDLASAAKTPQAADSVSRAAVQFEDGVLDYRSGRLSEARARLRAALATDRAFGLDAAAFEAEVALARVDAATGHTGLAQRDLDAGLQLSEVLRMQVADPELRATSMQPLRAAFDLKIDLLAAASQQAANAGSRKEAEGAARAALAVTERSRARVMQDIALAEYTQGNDARVDSLMSQKSKVLRDLAAHEDRLEAGGIGSDTDLRVAAIRADITHLRGQLTVLDSQLAILGRTGTPLLHGHVGAVTEPPSDVAVISYWLGSSKAYAWLQTRSQVHLIELGTADTLRTAAEAAHSAYGNPTGVSTQERLRDGANLSRLVLQPVLAQLPAGISRLVIIPDGPLHYISFAALPIGSAAMDPFLVEKYEVAYGSSIARLLAPKAGQRPTDERMLLVADAVYGADDPRLLRPTPTKVALTTDRPQLRSAVNMNALERLPATADEASGIARTAAPLRVDYLSGFGATRDAVLSRPLERYRYIHFAVHATTDATIPQLS